jgi:hypothetical protein
MDHREERELTITLHLSASFEPDYQGDEDGYAWFQEFQKSLRPELERAVFGALRSHSGYSALAAPRGRDPESVLEIDVSYRPGAS